MKIIRAKTKYNKEINGNTITYQMAVDRSIFWQIDNKHVELFLNDEIIIKILSIGKEWI